MLVWLSIRFPQCVKAVLYESNDQRELHQVAFFPDKIDQEACKCIGDNLISGQRCQVVRDKAPLGLACLHKA